MADLRDDKRGTRSYVSQRSASAQRQPSRPSRLTEVARFWPRTTGTAPRLMAEGGTLLSARAQWPTSEPVTPTLNTAVYRLVSGLPSLLFGEALRPMDARCRGRTLSHKKHRPSGSGVYVWN